MGSSPVNVVDARSLHNRRLMDYHDTLSAEHWSNVVAGFEARPGQVNEWTIPLPDELLAAVREVLKGAAK